MKYDGKISIKLAKKIKETTVSRLEIDKEFVKFEFQNLNNNKTKIENRKFVSDDNFKVLKFINDKLPKWLFEHNILYETNIQDYLLAVLEQIYEENPKCFTDALTNKLAKK